MKKLLFILITVVFVISACSSSGNSTNNSESEGGKVKLTYWVPFSGSDGEFMEDMVSKFNESQEDIEVEFSNNNWKDYYPKFKSALVSQTAPDVAVSHVSHLADLVPTGQLEPLDELAEEADLDWSTYSENQESSVILDEDHYAVPLDTHAMVMFYNKKHLADAGLLDDDEEIIMDDGAEGFTELLEKLKGELPEDVSPMVIATDDIQAFWTWYTLLYQKDEKYLDDDEIKVNSPESKEVVNLLKEWIDNDLMPTGIGENSYDLFKTGKAAITFNGIWATGNFEDDSSLEFGVEPIPNFYDKQAVWGDSHTLVVPKQDNKEKQLAALKFADWLAEHGEMWSKAGHVPVKQKVLESDEYKEMPYRSDYEEVMDFVEYMPKTPELEAINDAIFESLTEINNGETTVDDGLDDAQEKVESLIE